MTPAYITALSALLEILTKVGSWKVGSFLALIAFLPHIIFVIIILVILVKYDRAVGKYDLALKEMQKQRVEFDAKYDNNVELVKQVGKIAESLQDVVILNTQVMQGVKDHIENNRFCPVMSKEGRIEVGVKSS